MKTTIIIAVIAAIGIISFILRKKNKRTPNLPKQIQLNELEFLINELTSGKLASDFFGITSDGVDCIYFANNYGKVNIEYEVMSNNQKPYVEKIIAFAKNKNYKVSKTTYGNQPNYSEINEAPVYIIELNATKTQAAHVGTELIKTVFNKNENTSFEVVP